MRGSIRALIVIIAVMFFIQTSSAGVLVTQETVFNGKKNLADPAFLDAANEGTGLSAAVKSHLTGSLPLGQAVKTDILRATIEAMEHLPGARGLYQDITASRLYDALLMYDIMPDKTVFNETEIASFKNSARSILNYYSLPDNFAWEDDRWCLGATAMRLIASQALFSFNFPEDPESDSFRARSMRYFARNLNNSIDEFGGWLPDPPGIVDTALEYIIITAKAYKNAGLLDAFSDPRLISLMKNEIRLLPPQQAELVRNRFVTSTSGETDITKKHAATVILAAMDIQPHSPETAAGIVWFWNRCGRPVNDLGVLFIDSTISPLEPTLTSSLTGNGSAVFRNNFGMSIEDYFQTNFGGGNIFPDRHGHRHADSGDFSFIWNGIPLIVHEGFSKDAATKHFVNNAAWSHSTVMHHGAGDSPVLSGSALYKSTVEKSAETAPADYYSGGVRQFFSRGPVDYVSGEVRMSKGTPDLTSYYRHFLFLKPEALIVWDQVSSPYPLEWNLVTVSENTWAEGNVLHVHSPYDVDLQLHFSGDGAIDFSTEETPKEIEWDWPLVMRTKRGQGTITVVCLNLFKKETEKEKKAARDLFRNLLTAEGIPSSIGLISRSRGIHDTLMELSLPFETLTYESGNNGFDRFSVLIIGDDTNAQQERLLYDYGWKINDFVESGGNVVVFADHRLPWLSGTTSGQNAIPAMITIGAIPENIDVSDVKLMLHSDPLWETPVKINAESFLPVTVEETFETTAFTVETALIDSETVMVIPDSLIAETAIEETAIPEILLEDIASCLPVRWSDSWKALASIPVTFPLDTDSGQYGTRSRIRVRHPASRDYFTLFLPRKIGEQTYKFDIKRTEPGFIAFADPLRTWEIKAGEATWTDANLSVMIDSSGVKNLYAFDCTYIRIGEETIESESPMTIYYSEASDSGTIMTATNNVISSSKHILRPYAGELEFKNLFGKLSLQRSTYLTTLEVIDDMGDPVGEAEVHGEGQLYGITDKHGMLPVRWASAPPTVRISHRGKETLMNIVPGLVKVTLTER